MLIGKIGPLTRGETEITCAMQLQPLPIGRAWEYWTTRLEKSGGLPPAPRGGGQARPAGKSQPRKAQSGNRPRAAKPTRSARQAR
jgi:hypothetical protein